MKKEKIEAFIKDALKESTFVHHLYGEVSLAKDNGLSVSLDREFIDGIDIDEGKATVRYNFSARFVTCKDENGFGSENLSSHNILVATISKDKAEIKQPVTFG